MIDTINEDSSLKMLQSAEEISKANEFMKLRSKEVRIANRRYPKIKIMKLLGGFLNEK